MKSERRHELQHNELADWLAKTGQSLKPYQNLILLVVVLGMVGIASYVWWSKTTSSQAAEAWSELNTGLERGDLTKLAQVTETYPDSKVARTANVLSAEYHLIDGCNQLFHNKTIGEQQLNKAIYAYELELREGKSSLLRERATFGLAQAKEAKGDLDEAAGYYKDLVKNWPDGAYTAVAEQRLRDLKRPDVRKMYTDFRSFTPAPPVANELPMPGQTPAFDTQNIPKEQKSLDFDKLDLNGGKEKKEEPKK